MKSSTIRKVNELSKKTNLSVNRILNECIEQALKVLTEKEFNKIQEKKVVKMTNKLSFFISKYFT